MTFHKFCSYDLEIGQIVPTRILTRDAAGCSVITGREYAKWRGEDRDVYAHIETWYQSRPATDEETATWDAYLVATNAWRAVLKEIKFEGPYSHVDESGVWSKRLQMLDSYDDRFDGSLKCYPLTPEQRASYDAFAAFPEPLTVPK